MIDRRAAIQRITAVLGFTLSGPTLAGLLSGCQPPGPGAGLRTLAAAQKSLLDVLTEHILPRTDTLGANAAGVTEFIDMMMTDFYAEADRGRFFDGLASLDAEDFLRKTASEQFARLDALDAEAFPDLAVMSEADRTAFQTRRAAEGRPFIATLKELTLAGYYTSEIGATQELRVNPMGSFRGDISVSEVERAWA